METLVASTGRPTGRPTGRHTGRPTGRPTGRNRGLRGTTVPEDSTEGRSPPAPVCCRINSGLLFPPSVTLLLNTPGHA
ncbi:hypothetical protein EYF80_044268 [Liparis tanakae]|uniref:Uncharacterized protein n=1 Tax=Liparis tanakae TaxID=230148 RepID=A0A4Z2FYX2_9TELE|nr:hypothetical protein EYF80_044268 [Liparis tanakae]